MYRKHIKAVHVKFLKRLINKYALLWIDARMIIMYLESTQPYNHHFDQKYVDHIMMSISLVKMYSYYEVDSVVIS